MSSCTSSSISRRFEADDGDSPTLVCQMAEAGATPGRWEEQTVQAMANVYTVHTRNLAVLLTIQYPVHPIAPFDRLPVVLALDSRGKERHGMDGSIRR